MSTRVVFPEGTHDTILRACRIMVDEGIATPIIVGDSEEIRVTGERLGLELGGVSVVDPSRSPRYEAYVEEYFRMRARRGVTRDVARLRLARPGHFATMMLRSGDADMMSPGGTTHYPESVRTVLEVIGPAPGVGRLSGLHMVLLPKQVYFMADCALNIDPTAEDLAEIALLSARTVRLLGIEPRVAMLSFSNFGGSEHPLARKVRRATAILRERAPDVIAEGEMQVATALDGAFRRRYFPFSELQDDANVLIFPDLQSGSLALSLLNILSTFVAVGPLLMGIDRPVHPLRHGASVEDVVNLAALGAVVAAGQGSPGSFPTTGGAQTTTG
ncbi:MAG: hypothetical protein HY815_31595 [Candidatus Riflebacteria bacterium]|nr:hypothetical protein [Candidatus Riflebacteria bacterium]